jgi:hypothetical protein
VRRAGFETEPRWGGSTITRVVADRGTCLMSEGGHHGTVPSRPPSVTEGESSELHDVLAGVLLPARPTALHPHFKQTFTGCFDVAVPSAKPSRRARA